MQKERISIIASFHIFISFIYPSFASEDVKITNSAINDPVVADAVVDNSIFHINDEVEFDKFVERVNSHFSLRGDGALTRDEMVAALQFHVRQLRPLSEKNINVLQDVISREQIPRGTEVSVFKTIMINDNKVSVSVIKLIFGQMGLLDNGVVMVPSEEQAVDIFSVYLRFGMDK